MRSAASRTVPRWNPVRARAWMERAASTMMMDAVGARDCAAVRPLARELKSTAGALFWALRMDMGARTRAEFVAYLTEHAGYLQADAGRAAEQIENDK